MASLNEVLCAVADYRSGKSSLDEFADWLRKLSRRKFAESKDAQKAILEIESAFSGLEFEGIAETEFRRELAKSCQSLGQI